jgi:hypothetical protein
MARNEAEVGLQLRGAFLKERRECQSSIPQEQKHQGSERVKHCVRRWRRSTMESQSGNVRLGLGHSQLL